jgi:hypothetical protein
MFTHKDRATMQPSLISGRGSMAEFGCFQQRDRKTGLCQTDCQSQSCKSPTYDDNPLRSAHHSSPKNETPLLWFFYQTRAFITDFSSRSSEGMRSAARIACYKTVRQRHFSNPRVVADFGNSVRSKDFLTQRRKDR